MGKCQIVPCFLTANTCYKAGLTIEPKGIMLHSSCFDNPYVACFAQPEEQDDDLAALVGSSSSVGTLNNRLAQVCYHALVGKLRRGNGAVQTLPLNYRGWHAGSGERGRSANDTHISINILEAALGSRAYFASVYRIAVELSASICSRYGLDPMEKGVVISHLEGYQLGIASHREEVERWLPSIKKSMDDFRKDVATAVSKARRD